MIISLLGILTATALIAFLLICAPVLTIIGLLSYFVSPWCLLLILVIN